MCTTYFGGHHWLCPGVYTPFNIPLLCHTPLPHSFTSPLFPHPFTLSPNPLHPRLSAWIHAPFEQTNTCKNNTFALLRLRVVTRSRLLTQLSRRSSVRRALVLSHVARQQHTWIWARALSKLVCKCKYVERWFGCHARRQKTSRCCTGGESEKSVVCGWWSTHVKGFETQGRCQKDYQLSKHHGRITRITYFSSGRTIYSPNRSTYNTHWLCIYGLISFYIMVYWSIAKFVEIYKYHDNRMQYHVNYCTDLCLSGVKSSICPFV